MYIHTHRESAYVNVTSKKVGGLANAGQEIGQSSLYVHRKVCMFAQLTHYGYGGDRGLKFISRELH